MSTDLMEMVKGAVSRSVMEKLGGMMGTASPEKTSSVLEAAAGTILGGLIKKAGSPGGAEEVFRSAQKTEGGVLDRLGDLMGGGAKTDEYQKSGNGILEMIFGGRMEGIANTISKATGVDAAKIKSLLAMVAPMILAVIGKYVKNRGMNAVGLESLLGDQQQHLGKYLPAGLGSQLGLGNLAAAPAAVPRSMPAATAPAGSASKILVPLIVIGLLVAAAVWWIANRPSTGLGPNPNIRTPELTEDPDAAPDEDAAVSDDAGINVAGIVEKLQGLANNLDDVDLAKATGLVRQIGELRSTLDPSKISALPEPQKAMLFGAIDTFRERFEAGIQKIPNATIRGMLENAVGPMFEKISALRN